MHNKMIQARRKVKKSRIYLILMVGNGDDVELLRNNDAIAPSNGM